jgi:hypothetical protein
MVYPFRELPFVDLRHSRPKGEAPRKYRHEPHQRGKIDEVRAYVQTTTLPHRAIARKTGVDKGTVSRWSAKFGWTRPPGAWPSTPRPETRYEPYLVGQLHGRLPYLGVGRALPRLH